MNERRYSSSSTQDSLELTNWRDKRQRLFIYWCFTHFIHGMVHSIRYSSQYLYFKDVMRVSNPDLLYGLSVSFIGATGVVFPLLISPFIDRSRNIKQAILAINICGLIGNLLYALPFSPALPLLGQLLAGTTPAFGVIAIGEISRSYLPEKLTKRVSALSLIYSIGTFTSIGLVFTFLYVDFYIGEWHINFANMPGIFLAFAFFISTILAPFLVSDISKEYDLKLEERIKRSSCGSTPNTVDSAINTPDLSPPRRASNESTQLDSLELQQLRNKNNIAHVMERGQTDLIEKIEEKNLKISREVGEPFYFTLTKYDNEDVSQETYKFPKFAKNGYTKLNTSESDLSSEKTKDSFRGAKVTFRSIWKILRYRTTAILMLVTFIEAFVYSMIVTSLPVLATKFLKWGKVELALLSMVNKFLSVIISGSVYFLADCLPDVLLLIYGTFSSILALLALSLLKLVSEDTTATTVMLFLIAGLSISGVPLIITSTRSMLAKVVPSEIQSLTEAVRMSIFEASFVPAGFLVPIVTVHVTETGLTLMAVTFLILLFCIREIPKLVELKEDDDYWLEGDILTDINVKSDT